MALEMTENRMKNLAAIFGGEITIEGERQNEIVVRIPFSEPIGAELAYNHLLDIVDDRCINCGRYVPTLIGGMCEECWNKED